MRIPPLPKRWLIHDIIYQERLPGKDSYGNPLFAEPIIIKHVRFDDSTVFSRDATDTKIVANAVIFVDATHSTNLPERFVEESKITFNGKEYTIKKVIDCYYPYKDEIRHWELEVI